MEGNQRMLNWINIYWEKIVRSYKWAKFGWNDNDYDYTQIFEAIIFKLKAHSKAMCEHHKNDIFNDDVIDMNIAADWIRRVIDEENLFSVSNTLDENHFNELILITIEYTTSDGTYSVPDSISFGV